MPKQKIKFLFLIITGYFFIFAKPAKAVIPPDFIFSITAQIVQFFSIIMIFLATILGTLVQFFKTKYYTIRHKKTILTLIIIGIVLVSFVSSYFYATHKQEVEYQKWLNESEKYNIVEMENEDMDSDGDGLTDLEEVTYGTNPHNADTDGDSYSDGEEVANGYDPLGSGKTKENIEKGDANDQLAIGAQANENIDTSDNTFVSNVEITDASTSFINEYYSNMANSKLTEAYEMSKKSVSYSTFESWYLETTKITIDKLIRIDETKSSIELTLFEGEKFTRYGVLMALELRNEIPQRVASSNVKILAEGTIQNQIVSIDEQKLSDEYAFFDEHKNKNLLFGNQELQDLISSSAQDYIILDAREDIEYENGYFPASEHIRFADLKAGQWIEIPDDKFVYVLCWSGIRGKEVAEFLRTKKIVASYLEEGANGWVEFGGHWIGSIKFGAQYNESRYQIVFDTDDVRQKVRDGAFLVDTREPYKFKQTHITGSVNIPIMYTPTVNIENVFAQVPANSQIITVCDGYVNCFDAKITGVELERRGHQFLGRYNKPWEYEN
ncbi:rhodanese-like domain-containing protein [Candidatus Parcubacteria bacterium]|jgi:rhodanese-related sulfurtransferase|nr:rhodanese-like domain-containing protein [Candidatus Parcubacteria bacterium]MBT7228291.1 rhodanese-like domain-containing protein [Candidatus Parcubacteria bacterium]